MSRTLGNCVVTVARQAFSLSRSRSSSQARGQALHSWQPQTSSPAPTAARKLRCSQKERALSSYAPRRQQAEAVAATAHQPLARTVGWDNEAQELTLDFSSNGSGISQFPYLWLRDNCLCCECTHPHTKQRQISTFEIPEEITVSSVEPDSQGLKIQWSDRSHQSYYPWTWLQENNPINHQNPTGRTWKHVTPSSDAFKYPTTSYEAITQSTRGLTQWLSQIRTYGFAFVSDMPPTPEATETLLQQIAFIRPTHYGGFWDFTSQAKPTDTAYTNLGLPNHTDTTYFTDPCGLQMFHVLQPATGGGGESTLVDGFAAAEYLYYSDSAAYHALATTPIISHASGNAEVGSIDNTAVSPSGYPVLSHDPSAISPLEKPSPESLTQVRWNNDDRHSRTRWPSRKAMETWYDAARKWNGILTLSEFEIEVQLQPGTPVIFDNQRVLHGRRAFEGSRRVCGGYIGMDDFLARLRSVTK